MIYFSACIGIQRNNGKIECKKNFFGGGNETKELWYEMPASISPYLNNEDATPFLVALLPQVAYLGEDFVVEGAVS